MEGEMTEAVIRRDIKKIFEEAMNEEKRREMRCPKRTRIPIFMPTSLKDGEIVETKYEKMMKRLEKYDY